MKNFKNAASVLCLVQMISLGNAMDAPNGIPSKDELIELAESFRDKNQELFDFYFDIYEICELTDDKMFEYAKEKYYEVRKKYPNHNSPNENYLFSSFTNILLQEIDTFIKNNKDFKDDSTQLMLSEVGMVKYYLKSKDWNGVKSTLPQLKITVSEYLKNIIAQNKQNKDETMQILLGYSGYALNHLNDMQNLGNMVTGLKKFLNTNKNTMNAVEKNWGENIVYLAELIHNIMFDKSESIPKEAKMPQMPKVDPDALLKQKRLNEEKKADEQRQAGDLAQKRATIRRADLFYKDSLMEFGLPENATFEDVKKKYRRLMLEMHPDKVKETPEIKERREQIQQAWDQLQAHFRQGLYEGL